MTPSTDSKSTCVKCNSQLDKKEIKPEQCDVNTKSLLLMFRLPEILLLECPKCGDKRIHV